MMVKIPTNDPVFTDLIRAIAQGDTDAYSRLIKASPVLVGYRAVIGAARTGEQGYYFEQIRHFLYAGDTALHMAAAGFRTKIVRNLIDLGADCSARNRHGAQPLHYAADTNRWDPIAQTASIEGLLGAGADPNAMDRFGVTPLHRAVRTRGAAAVGALLSQGADPRKQNKNGSTPLHLAVQNTGRGGSGTGHAREQQKQIILALLQHGASLDDKDGKGKTVAQAATAGWIQDFLKDRK